MATTIHWEPNVALPEASATRSGSLTAAVLSVMTLEALSATSFKHPAHVGDGPHSAAYGEWDEQALGDLSDHVQHDGGENGVGAVVESRKWSGVPAPPLAITGTVTG